MSSKRPRNRVLESGITTLKEKSWQCATGVLAAIALVGVGCSNTDTSRPIPESAPFASAGDGRGVLYVSASGCPAGGLATDGKVQVHTPGPEGSTIPAETFTIDLERIYPIGQVVVFCGDAISSDPDYQGKLLVSNARGNQVTVIQ